MNCQFPESVGVGSVTPEDPLLPQPDSTIAILPIASTEQHGPHLPIATDVAIATGMLAELKVQRPDDLDFLVLPTQEIGKANEHVYGPGTLSLSAELLIPGPRTIDGIEHLAALLHATALAQ